MSNLARCRTCKQRIVFFGSPFTGNPRAFEPKPVDARIFQGVAYPVMSRRAYRFGDLVERLWPAQREGAREAVEDEVRDLPWHVLHECRAGEPLTTDRRGT